MPATNQWIDLHTTRLPHDCSMGWLWPHKPREEVNTSMCISVCTLHYCPAAHKKVGSAAVVHVTAWR